MQHKKKRCNNNTYIYIYILHIMRVEKTKCGSRRFSTIFCSHQQIHRHTLSAHTHVCVCVHIYIDIIDTRTRGKTVPQYVRCREHMEEDLQPRKLYYSGRLAPAVENKDCRNKGFFLLLLFAFASATILLFTHASCAYVLCDTSGPKETKNKKIKK